MTRLRILFLLLLTLAWSGPVQAAGKRVALVIGNASYQHTSPLKNPANDARDMAEVLRRIGFEVIEGIDLDQAAMQRKIREFSTAIEGAEVALFYYAGHGLQVDGNNYLAPVSARLEKEGDLDFETVPLNFILRQMERERRTNLVLLDACRDNPLARQLARSTRSTAVGNGLARVESGVGMLIGYATSPNSVALDGEGRNSPYTRALLKHIETPGEDIHSIMIKVRQDVLTETNNKQLPWEHSSLTGRFFFKPKPAASEATSAAAPPPAPSSAPAPAAGTEVVLRQEVAEAYRATTAIGTCGAYRAFEEQHRGSFYARLAEEYLRSNCQTPPRAVAVEAAPSKPEQEAEADKPAPQTAALEPREAPAQPPDPEPALSGSELALAVQRELDRVGCDPGPLDGSWGARSQAALETFARYAKLRELASDAPTSAVLAALQKEKGRVCPLECGPRFEARGDRCVRKVCGRGQILTPAGDCVVRPKVVRPPVARQAPPAARKPATKREDANRGICFDTRNRIVSCDSPDVRMRIN